MIIDYTLIGMFTFYLLFECFQKFNKTENINTYAIGNKTFSTFALTATISATWISGSGFILDLQEYYNDGFKYFLISIGMCLNLTLVSLLAPKMGEFLGKTSVASIMGNNYGEIVQNITSILGCVTSCGSIAIQFKIMGNVIQYLLPITLFKEYLDVDLHLYFCVVIGGIITTAYTYSGGIRSVVRTDIVQICCLTIALIIAIVTFDTQNLFTNSYEKISIENLQKFQFVSLFKLTGSEIFDLFLLFGYFIVPGLRPNVIQRISMANNLQQVKNSHFYSSILLFITLTISCYISYLIFIANPNIENGNILPFLINAYNLPGTKAILIIGIIAMCMSTADSGLNISAVLLANDFWLFKNKNSIEKIYLARNFTIFIGIISIIFACKQGSLFSIILLSSSFYLPIVSVPLLALIFNLKTTPRVCLITMILSFSFVIIFKFIFPIKQDVNFLGMVLNGFLLLSFHYILEKWELLKKLES
jgi:Na+/proline symporter